MSITLSHTSKDERKGRNKTCQIVITIAKINWGFLLAKT